MAAKKRSGEQEPLLNTAARKLGHAAGALTKATHQFTESLSGLAETVESKVRDAANIGSPRERSKSHARSPEKRSPKKKTRKSVRTKKAKKAGRVKGQGPGGKTRRGGAKIANVKK